MEAKTVEVGRYMVFNIGCIECGVSSAIVGFFHNKEAADAVETECHSAHNWREGGQNDFVVFDLAEPLSEEYRAAIQKATGENP